MIDLRGTGAVIGSRVNDCSGRSTIDSWLDTHRWHDISRRPYRTADVIKIYPMINFTLFSIIIFAQNTRKTEFIRNFLSRISVFYRQCDRRPENPRSKVDQNRCCQYRRRHSTYVVIRRHSSSKCCRPVVKRSPERASAKQDNNNK